MTDNITVENIPYIGYCFAFMEHRSAFSDYFAREASENGRLLCARIDGKFVGYICAAGGERETRITYAYTVPDHRKKGVFTALLGYVAGDSLLTVKVGLPENDEFHDTVADVCKKLGFRQGESIIVYTYRPAEDTLWRNYMDTRGDRICEMLKRHGFKTVSFAEADADIIGQIRESDKNEFGNPFETRSFLDDPARNMSWELSFAAVKDGELAAYTLVSLPSPKKGVLEQMAVSKKKRGSGIILLPFAASVETFLGMGGEMASYAIYGSNTHANAFRDKLTDIASKKVSENYYHYIFD